MCECNEFSIEEVTKCFFEEKRRNQSIISTLEDVAASDNTTRTNKEKLKACIKELQDSERAAEQGFSKSLGLVMELIVRSAAAEGEILGMQRVLVKVPKYEKTSSAFQQQMADVLIAVAERFLPNENPAEAPNEPVLTPEGFIREVVIPNLGPLLHEYVRQTERALDKRFSSTEVADFIQFCASLTAAPVSLISPFEQRTAFVHLCAANVLPLDFEFDISKDETNDDFPQETLASAEETAEELTQSNESQDQASSENVIPFPTDGGDDKTVSAENGTDSVVSSDEENTAGNNGDVEDGTQAEAKPSESPAAPLPVSDDTEQVDSEAVEAEVVEESAADSEPIPVEEGKFNFAGISEKLTQRIQANPEAVAVLEGFPTKRTRIFQNNEEALLAWFDGFEAGENVDESNTAQ